MKRSFNRAISANSRFVSHQWLSATNPDPTFQQLTVLQTALKNILAGAELKRPPADELIWGRMKSPTVADFQQVFLWYDYFSIPQSAARAEERRAAIDSICSFVSRCFFFVILCPTLRHEEGYLVSRATWAQRGWTRMERMAQELGREDVCVISVQMASHPTLDTSIGGVGDPGRAPGMGHFTVDDDRKPLGSVMHQLIGSKLASFLVKGDFHNYRFLMCLQGRCLGGLGTGPLEALAPGFSTEIDPFSEPDAFVVARFLHETGFKHVRERDAAGWTPICYAVLKDDPFLVEALVNSRADVNDSISKGKYEAKLPRHLPILQIACAYHCNRAMCALLSARANVNAQAGIGGTALTVAAAYNNMDAVQLLAKADVDPDIDVFPGTSAFKVACGHSGPETIREMMRLFPVNLRFSLHCGLAFFAEGHTVRYLIEARADINEQLSIPMRKGTWWAVLKALSLRHRFSPSPLTYLAYHHRGATPLMFSIMTGNFEAACILVAAGARSDLRNYRGRTAQDMVEELGAPISLDRGYLEALGLAATSLPRCSQEESAEVDYLISESV
ncbi:unnamed protein product [Symbiodinium natans]|uniref:Uncharacterized protein n=1 Tax=Symbiodinium natans TaxID=878477 RepID=A0A812QH99_9DINO|nr:unnamed protein product [Symbiodinium natans]